MSGTWKFRDFTHHSGNVGRFEVWCYNPNYSYDHCKVATYCQTDAGVKWASQVYYDLAISKMKSPDFKIELHIQTKKSKTAGVNFGRIEVAAILDMPPAAAMAALLNVANAPEAEVLDIKPGALSVGPCAWRSEDGTFVRVRFNGFSIPFFFDKENFLPAPTQKLVTKEVGGSAAEAAFKVLVDNKEILHKRAVERPLNLCGIADYAQHNLKVLKGDGTGKYFTATQAEMADPKSDLITVFTYGYRESFAVIKDEVYKVKGFVNGYDVFTKGASALPNENSTSYMDYQYGNNVIKGYLRIQDCIPLDPEDQFVREKIGRSLKAKL